MKNSTFLLVEEGVLPEVFSKVIQAKEYLASAQAQSASQAARMAGISRSAFYKYKDSVYAYKNRAPAHIITVHAVLQDKPGVLMALVSAFYRAGANILTVNQNIPVSGAALVAVSARTDSMRVTTEELLSALRMIDGVKTIENIAGE